MAEIPEIEIAYTNWKGEFAMRRIKPVSLYFGSNKYHPEPTWLVEAIDVERGALRTFALDRIGHPEPRDVRTFVPLDK